jgi:TatD DNase family protein
VINIDAAMLIDTHAHLDFPEFAEDLDDVLLGAKQAGVERIITIGRTLQSSRKAIQLAERCPQIYASVGIHPNSASQEREDFLSELEEMVKHPKVVAVGAAFEQHLELAAAAGKSVVIHQRDSWEDAIEVLRKYSTRVRAVMHCFDAGLAQAQEVVDLGHFVSFSGVVTFENASEVREAAKSVPIERIMVETNAPYFAPAPNCTKRCEPAFIRETAAFIANLRGISLAAFAAQTTQNAQAFFEFNT